MAKAAQVAKTAATSARVGDTVDVDYGSIAPLGQSGGPPPPNGPKPPKPPPKDPDEPQPVVKPGPPPEEKPPPGENGDGEGEDEDNGEGEDEDNGDDGDDDGEGKPEPGEGKGGKDQTVKQDIKDSQNAAKQASKPEDEDEGPQKWEPRTKDHTCGAAGVTPEELAKIVEEAKNRKKDSVRGTTQARIEEMRKETAREYRRFRKRGTWQAKGGTGSGGMDRWAEAVDKGGTVKWEQLLKRTLRTLVGKLNDRYKTQVSYAKLSRRTMAQYMGKETPIEPAYTSSPFGFDVALAVDTSASVDEYGLGQCLREVVILLKAPGVARVLWMSIDWAVAAVTEIIPEGIPTGKKAAMKKLQPFFKGGGGTDMRQAIYYVIKANKERKSKQMTEIPAVVVFTDGGTEWPEAKDVRRSKLEVIVVLISPGNDKGTEAHTKRLAPYAKIIVAR